MLWVKLCLLFGPFNLLHCSGANARTIPVLGPALGHGRYIGNKFTTASWRCCVCVTSMKDLVVRVGSGSCKNTAELRLYVCIWVRRVRGATASV